MQDEKKITELVKSLHTLNNTLVDHIRRSENFDIGIKINVDNLVIGLGKLEALITGNYVRKEEFEPVKRMVYGLASLLLVGVVGGMVAAVVK